jgi:L-alanine-DL-glutamate epimerase-like enolase superfamily enzyme
MTKIDRIILHTTGTEVDLTYGSFGTSYLKAFVIEIEAGGCVGIGECSADDWRGISARKLAIKMALRIKANADATKPSKSLQRYPSLSLSVDPWSFGPHRLITTIREGFSIALYDLAAKLKDLTIMELIGKTEAREIEGMPVVHKSEPAKMGSVSKVWCDTFNYKHLKPKLSSNLEHSRQALGHIREEVGDEVTLQVDFNYAYTNARQCITDMNKLHEEFNIVMFEDPIRPTLQLYPLPFIRKEISTCLLVDGVAYWPNIIRLCHADGADRFNQHTNAQGGIDLALKISQYAEAKGIPTSIGSSGLVGIQDRAFQLLSHYIGTDRPSESIGFPLYYHEAFEGFYGSPKNINVLSSGLNEESSTFLPFPDTPGFGFNLDRRRLDQLCIEETLTF